VVDKAQLDTIQSKIFEHAQVSGREFVEGIVACGIACGALHTRRSILKLFGHGIVTSSKSLPRGTSEKEGRHGGRCKQV
jgi:hypothetical protein